MPVSVYVPTPFRRATGGQARVEADGADIQAVLDGLDQRFEGLRGLVRNEQGQVHHHVNVYVNGEEVKAGDEVSIIPALAGGGPGRP